ncbi:MAG: DoxX family protein [Chlorobiota bacterium]|nr:MAG: DoxX family protein [Chlorobiota bacterium]
MIRSVDDNRSILPRLLVGLVFVSEGIQKFLYPDLVGAGRFTKIGFENPEFLAYFVAVFEVVCGALVLAGFMTRLAAIPLVVIMSVAIYTTKIPVLMKDGFWSMAHASRNDFSMTMMLIFLLIYGAGKYSFDKMLEQRIR